MQGTALLSGSTGPSVPLRLSLGFPSAFGPCPRVPGADAASQGCGRSGGERFWWGAAHASKRQRSSPQHPWVTREVPVARGQGADMNEAPGNVGKGD